jgi:hypothetical protein
MEGQGGGEAQGVADSPPPPPPKKRVNSTYFYSKYVVNIFHCDLMAITESATTFWKTTTKARRAAKTCQYASLNLYLIREKIFLQS